MSLIHKLKPRLALIYIKSSNSNKLIRNFCSTNKIDETEKSVQKSGFAKAFEKHSTALEKSTTDNEKPKETFASLLKNSKFIDLGDPEKKIVTGKIIHVVEDDLYIDFGWKFHCVCSRPTKSGSDYVRGAKVRLRIKELELSTKFLGSSKDLTILEADCQLLGLVSSPTFSKRI